MESMAVSLEPAIAIRKQETPEPREALIKGSYVKRPLT